MNAQQTPSFCFTLSQLDDQSSNRSIVRRFVDVLFYVYTNTIAVKCTHLNNHFPRFSRDFKKTFLDICLTCFLFQTLPSFSRNSR